MKVGFVGFGEAAYSICRGFHQQNQLTDIFACDAMLGHGALGAKIAQRAAQTNVRMMDSAREVAAQADVLFSAVPCTRTVAVAREIGGSLREGLIYADLSASAPQEKHEIWEIVKDRGVLFVDAALLGSVPVDLHRTPILASGNGADAFLSAMSPYGMQIESIQGKAGDASAVKLVRSIYMKGVSAILLEMMCAADIYGVTDQVVSSLSRSMDPIPFVSHLNRLVTGMAVHAERRAVELGNSVELQKAGLLDHSMSSAAQRTHELVLAAGLPEKFAGERPGDWREVISAMNASEAMRHQT